MYWKIKAILRARGVDSDDFSLCDTGEGAFIERWGDALCPQPTAAELAAADGAREEARPGIFAQIAALDLKRVRPASEIAEALANGVTPDPVSVGKMAELNAQIATLRAAL
jgi:hypothetical protein